MSEPVDDTEVIATTTKSTQENSAVLCKASEEDEEPQCSLDPSRVKRGSVEITAPHISGGHTFLVTTVVSETLTTTTNSMDTKEELLKAVPVLKPIALKYIAESDSTATSSNINQYISADVSSKAIVPLSSSLPSKLLRLHAKRSAQALLHQAEHQQSLSLDSQFSSDEGGASGGNSECEAGPSAPRLSTPPLALAHNTGEDEKLIDVGMGSSIEDSEESEEDDELKPLAVDNHMLHDVELGSPTLPTCDSQLVDLNGSPTSLLSEANLEKFHQHHRHHQHQQMDNIYLHPNFKYDIDAVDKELPDGSPPPAVAPANSPIEQRRVHRSFLTMKKPSLATEMEAEQAHSVASTDANSEQPLTNEIDGLDPALVPSEELAAEITEAVEFYFSNESILKDAFLLKHVRRNKEGFVSLKLVSSFKRVRQLTKEWKVVGDAVRRKSRKIELNDVGTKVRRIDPMPSFDETMPSRTIVACDLPLDKLNIEKVSDIFSKCGEIALIRILKPGMTIPVDVRQFMNKYPEMQQKECALVEYVESSSARDAKNLQGPFQVYEMVAPKKKTGKKATVIQVQTPVTRMVENYRYFNDATYERTRGGSFSGVVPHDLDLRLKLKRNNSDFNPKAASTAYADMQQQQQQHYQQHHHQQPHHHPLAHQQHHRGSFGGSAEHTHQFQHYQPRVSISHESVGSPTSGGMNFYAYSPRRYSNSSTISANTAANMIEPCPQSVAPATALVNNTNTNRAETTAVRRISNCSDNYSNYSEMSRRASNCSEHAPQRRDSNCSDNCPCSRRVSDFGNDPYRKTSQSSIGSGIERRFSNGSMQFERTFSTGSDMGNGNTGGGNISTNVFPRRMSNDFNYERRQSMDTQTGLPAAYEADGNVGGGGGGYMVFPRRYSNNFNNSNSISAKLAAYDNAQYINGRRISTDSGYDRRCSFGSEYEGSPRSRTGSFINNYKPGGGFDIENGQPRSRTNSFLDGSPRSRSGSFAQRNAENLVRTPIGPDGSKGFGTRARKFGQTVSPVN